MTTRKPRPSRRYLTASEVTELPEGMRVTVQWSGGNGPHDYVIAVGLDGQRYAAVIDDPRGVFRFYNPLNFVGLDTYHTHVWRTTLTPATKTLIEELEETSEGRAAMAAAQLALEAEQALETDV